MKNVPLGCRSINLPDRMLRKPTIKCLLSDSNHKPYHDNLCFFCALAFELYGSDYLALKTDQIFKRFIEISRVKLERFPGVGEDDIYILEDICEINIQLFNIDYNENGEIVGELTRRSALRFSHIVILIRYDNHICWTEKLNNLLKKFRCHTCDIFLSSTRNLLNHQTQCRENIKHVYPTGVYQLKETVFERLEDIRILVDNEVRLFTNFVVFDFESITVADNTLKNSDSTTWIGRHVPISVSISYSFGSGVIFLCNSDPK